MMKINKYKISLILYVSVTTAFICLFVLGMFTKSHHIQVSDIRPVLINEKDLENNGFWELDSRKKYFKSVDSFINTNKKLSNNEYDSVNLIKKNSLDECSKCNEDQFCIVDYVGYKECEFKTYIQSTNIHPLPILSTSINSDNSTNFHLLGTVEAQFSSIDRSNGVDIFYKLSSAFFNTIKNSLYSTVIFLTFGIFFAINIAYYNNIYLRIISETAKKTLECIPILLWMLIAVIVLSYTDLDTNMQISLYFIFFGLICSPTLANLIIQKINQLKKEDFIVALKLLGLSNFRIIFIHMLNYSCKPIIIIQLSNILAHSFFLDVTLNYIEKFPMDSGIYTLGSFFIGSMRDTIYYKTQIFLFPISFILVFTYYYIADFYKRKYQS